MTTPEPARAASATPIAQAYAGLLADLTSTLHLNDGLAQILAVSAPDLPVTAAPSVDSAATVLMDPHHGAHAALVADLEATLHLPDGLTEILDMESGHAGLVADLSVAIDTARGLADILHPVSGIPDALVVIHVHRSVEGAATPKNTSARAVPLGPSMVDNLSKIYSALDHHRLLLRTADSYRYLKNAMRELHHIHEWLDWMIPDLDQTDFHVAGVSAALGRQQALMARATTALSDALISRNDPQGDPADDHHASGSPFPVQATYVPLSPIFPHEPQGDLDHVDRSHPDVDEPDVTNLWRKETNDPAGAAHDFEQLLADQVRVLGPDHPNTLTTRHDLAYSRRDAGDHDSALSAAEAAPLLWKGREQAPHLYDMFDRDGVFDPYIRVHRHYSFDPAMVRPEREEALGIDCVLLAQFEQLMRQSADELGQLREQLVTRIDVMERSQHQQCLDLADGLAQMMAQVWAALSDFRGADLRRANLEPLLDNLDGVRWSDTTADGGATQWPMEMRDLVIEHSVPESGPEPGVFVIRFGAAIGVGR
jgi:Tetratricopeptide repeat